MGGFTKLPIPFSNPYTYKGHSGMDFPQKAGTIFRASGPGHVVTRSHNVLGGFYVWVQYDAGPKVGYHHMTSHQDTPPVGTRVQEGTILGHVGGLGQHSTGPHLHMQVAGEKDGSTFWLFFDRTRVVGQASPSGTPAQPEEEAEFMAKIDDLWQQWLPGQAGVKQAGGAYLLFVEILTKARTAVADTVKGVWGQTVTRGDKSIPALQELADAKTLGIDANTKLDELLKRPAVGLSDAQVDQLAQKVALGIAPAVLDAMAKRLES